jgi:hypothetical protein
MGIVSNALAEETVDLIKEGFSKGQDPDGNAWAPLSELTRSGDRGIPLNDTGTHLKNRVAVSWVGRNSYAVIIPFEHASVHQRGAVIVPVQARALSWFSTRYVRNIGRTKKEKKQLRRVYNRVFAKKVTIPARPMVPEGKLPDRWRRNLQEAFDDTMEAMLEGGK